jgi:stage V sporulation protein B
LLGGFPAALALATSKNAKQGWRLFERLSFILVILSAIMSFATFYFSEQIAALLGDPTLDFSIKCVSPAILVVPILSLLRGFLQGIESYTTIAVSELIEQAVRISVMISLVSLWITNGVGGAVGGATLGAFSGSVAALIFLSSVLFFKGHLQSNPGSILSRPGCFMELDPHMVMFLHTSLAIAGTRIILPISDFLDALIVPQRLQVAGLSVSQATSLFGEMSGMAATVAYIPTIMTAALTHTLTAKITADWQKKNFKRFFMRTKTSLEIGWFWGIGSRSFSLFLFFGSFHFSVWE